MIPLLTSFLLKMCKHYHSPLDIVAIRFKCCSFFYPCYQCHEERADHLPKKWEEGDLDEKAILCTKCHRLLTIFEYLTCESVCPFCNASFNPKCCTHWHYYFGWILQTL
ncbi:MAG: hypothetical protein KDK76_00660 [Chlamydiia bacterium]|nr:hypothetical protein [Chlamydiia bacterium]